MTTSSAAPSGRPLHRWATPGRVIPLLALVLTTAGCAQAGTSGPAQTAHTSSSLFTQPGRPSAAPDHQDVQLVKAGIGAYEETVLPVAIIKNLSTASSARRITVTWTVLTPRGAPFATVAGGIAILGAGETTVVGARIAGSDVGGSARATVEVGDWTSAVSAVITATPGGFTCGRCGPNAGYGDVTTTLTSNLPNPPSPLNVAVACTAADGTIDGGGSKQFAWTAAGLSQPASIPVLVNGGPNGCLVGATPAT